METREKIFRAYQYDTKTMCEFSMYDLIVGAKTLPAFEATGGVVMDIVPDLRDKKGQKIFEEDILKEDNGNLWTIKWYKTGLQMESIKTGEMFFTLKESCDLGILEVIGNTIENPEFVKKYGE